MRWNNIWSRIAWQQHVKRGLIMGVIVAALTSFMYTAGWLERVEMRLFDMRFVAKFLLTTVKEEIEEEVVVVAIDERSIDAVGSWPWSWRDQARLIEALTLADSQVIGLNVLHGDPATDDQWNERLSRAIGQHGRVVLAAASTQSGVVFPNHMVAAQAYDIGLIDIEADRDGVARRIVTKDRMFRPDPFAFVVAKAAGVVLDESIQNEPFYINYGQPIDNVHLKVDRMIQTLSAVDVMDGAMNEYLRNKIVLVGTATPGIPDLHATPLMASVPGVYLHAFAVQSLLKDNTIARTSPAFVLVAIWIIGLLGAIVAYGVRPWAILVATLFGLLGTSFFAVQQFIKENILVDVAPLFVTYIGVCVGGFIQAYASAERERRQTRALFRRYVATEVADQLLHNHATMESGKKAEVTVLFADIRGFTSFVESVSPERAVQVLDRYLQIMAEAVLAHGGTLDKYIGDAVMALFGAPLPRKDHVEAAIAAARTIQCDVAALSEKLNLPLQVGIGIHSGEVIVGSIGADQRREYTAIGDVVNVASRLEELAGPGETMISEQTYSLWQDAPSLQPAEHALRGKQATLKLYRCVFFHEHEDDHNEQAQAGGTA